MHILSGSKTNRTQNQIQMGRFLLEQHFSSQEHALVGFDQDISSNKSKKHIKDGTTVILSGLRKAQSVE